MTRPQPGGPVVVDTSVVGADLLKVRALLAASYQPAEPASTKWRGIGRND